MSDERFEAMLVEARDGPRAAEANEWLGRRLANDDAFRAKLCLSEATRLAPGRCAAWVELAQLIERTSPREALVAWDGALAAATDVEREAIRAQRAAFEARVLATRTPLDAVAERMAASLSVPTAVDPIGRTQRHDAFVALCTNVGGHRRVHALVVLTLMHGWLARVVTSEKGFADTSERDANAIATASANLAKHFLDDAALRPLDAALHVLELVRRELAGDVPWHFDATNLWIDDGQTHIAVRAPMPGMVHLSIEPAEAEGAEALACTSHAELVALQPAILVAAREAARANAAFRARPLGIRNVAPRLASAMRSAGISARSCAPAYRFGPGPSIASFAHEDVDLVMLIESPDALAITVGDKKLVARSYGEFERDLPAIVAAASAFVKRPLEPGLSIGRCYEVIAPFLDLAVGDRVKVTSSSWDHGDEHWFVTLATLSYPTRSISLGEEVLAEPARFLRRIPSESVAGLDFSG